MRRTTTLLVAVQLITISGVRAQQRPDTVVPIEPVVVRVLRGSVGTGSPYAVSVAMGAELTRSHAGAYLEEALRALPGVQIQNRFNLASGERLVLRGFGSRAQFGIRSLRILVDGIPATLPDGQTTLDHLDVSGLERVELLRGPGAAAYGNAAGGVLHFLSRAPGPETAAELNSAAGSNGLRTLSLALTGRAGTTAYRASAQRYAYDGFRRDPVADDGSTYGRQERSILNAAFHTNFAGGSLRVVVNGLDMAAANAGSLSRVLLDLRDRQAYRNSVLQSTREDIRQAQVGATWTGAVGGLDAEASAWGIRRDFAGRIPSDVVAFDRNAGGLRVFLSGSRRAGDRVVRLGAGIEVELQGDDRRNWTNRAGDKGPLTLDQRERVRGAGVFAQARAEPSSTLSLVAALRYDAFRFRALDRLLADGVDESGLRVMRATSPSVGIVWEAAPRVELFGSLATAFETPTTTELANRPDGADGFNPDLDPMRAVSAEGGARARIGVSWSLEATLFRTELRDELVPFEVSTSPGRTFYRNAGQSSHRGWEASAEGRPHPSLWLRVAYTRVDARFERYAVGGTDFSGNRIPGLAPQRLDGRVALEIGHAWIEARGLHQSAIPVNDAGTAESPSAFVADLRAGLEDVDVGKIRIAPFVAVANVLDRVYNAAVVVNAFGGRYFEPGPGRTFQAGVGMRFGGGSRRDPPSGAAPGTR